MLFSHLLSILCTHHCYF
uniref:Uncharacterized protein n=1 Tax=Arundo donax TaxID=35708 RepID=A0A0A9AKW5_ARUDO